MTTPSIKSATHRIQSWSKHWTQFTNLETGQLVRSRISPTSTATLCDLDTSKVMVRGYLYDAVTRATATKTVQGSSIQEAISLLSKACGGDGNVTAFEEANYAKALRKTSHATSKPDVALFAEVIFHPTLSLN